MPGECLERWTGPDGRIYEIHLATDDDVSELRVLVNSAYRELSDRGWNYTGTYQDETITRSRMRRGRCFVVRSGDTLLGTLSAHDENVLNERKCAYLTQFAVRPELKRSGLGTKLMDFIETWALRNGYECLQLDTAQPAVHLVDLYLRRGYTIQREVHFNGKTYKSWIFERPLLSAPR